MRSLSTSASSTVSAVITVHGGSEPKSRLLRILKTLRRLALNAQATFTARRLANPQELAFGLRSVTCNKHGMVREVVTLATELKGVREYLVAEQATCGDRLILDIICTADAGAVLFPKGALQKIVEQAVAGGVAQSTEPMMLTIFARRASASIRIACRWENALSAGLQPLKAANVKHAIDEIHALYGARATVEIENVGHFSAVTFTIGD